MPDDVTHIPCAEVNASFATGMPLIENGEFKVHASRRERPGQAEVHACETDIFHILQGSAILVTGGTVEESRSIAPGENRGTAIKGGQERRVAQGDVIIIPRGVPHWFKQVDPATPMLYFTVKGISPSRDTT